jgi:hypothetical protein
MILLGLLTLCSRSSKPSRPRGWFRRLGVCAQCAVHFMWDFARLAKRRHDRPCLTHRWHVLLLVHVLFGTAICLGGLLVAILVCAPLFRGGGEAVHDEDCDRHQKSDRKSQET